MISTNCLYITKWFQVLLFNTYNSIQHYSLICTQSNGSKYCYIIAIIQFRYTVKWFQTFLSNTNNSFEYLFICLHTFKWLQFLQSSMNSFFCTLLNNFRYCYLTLTIQFNSHFMHTVKWSVCYIWSIGSTLSGVTTQSLSGGWNTGNGGILQIPQSSKTGSTPTDVFFFHKQDIR